MILVYPFSLRDEELALKNAKWFNELGGCKGHEVVCVYDTRCDPGLVEEIGGELLKAFDKVYRLVGEAVDGWPEGANYLFRLSATWLQNNPRYPYFFWIEPDAIPLVPGWLDKLEAEYKRGKKPFMGDRVEVKIDGKEVPLHMSGIGIYENPIYIHAGEAYRAFDMAWDMAAKDQIIPNAHFTNLIEHAWKHPTFKDQFELRTQIAPETVLFHSSKDGSLIDLLRQKKGGDAPVTIQPMTPVGDAAPTVQSAGAAKVYDIFIRTFAQDYDWLRYCLQSIDKFCSGFRKVWIISPSRMPDWIVGRFEQDKIPVEWKIMNDESPDGYLAQQIAKCYADVITDYQADYILHVDSDVIFTRPVTPDIFFENGELLWYYTPHEAIETPWRPVIEKFIRQPVPYEFMRSMPFMVPRWLYPKLREYCHATHGMILSQYVINQPAREFSEFNVMGAYAYRNHTKSFKWINTLDQMPQHVARQFRSWDGITPETRAEIENILGGDATCSEPKKMNSEQSDAASKVQSSDAAIKVLPNDIWVLQGDQISGWVEQEGRLDHDQNFLPDIIKHIKRGDTVVDAGAFIGDHTIAYSEAVGEEGIVHAFEPNSLAYRCLSHNLESHNNVVLHGYGLSDVISVVPLSGNNGNLGGAYVGEHMKLDDVRVRPLETEVPWRVNFIKIDVEGYELKVLQGAGNLINHCRPKMVIEINEIALQRQGNTREDIFAWLREHDYVATIIQTNCCIDDPMYDILCLSNQKPSEEITQDATLLASSPVAPLTVAGLKEYIIRLKDFSESSPQNKAKVMRWLVVTGLKEKKKDKKK